MRTRHLKIRLDGPYGVAGIEWGLHPVNLIVAGGIGITPGISIATHIITQASNWKKVEQGSPKQWHVHVLWVVTDSIHAEWFKEELNRLASITADPLHPATFDLTIHVTGSKGAPLTTAEDPSTSTPAMEMQEVSSSEGTVQRQRISTMDLVR